MATISTDTYLDGGVARTAGETWTINSNAVLTIRTDSRWHSNSPASMAGSLGSITINEGRVSIDGTTVRWLPFNNGSGNVPAIGTNITQGGVTSSYLLAVYSSYTSAPVTVGNAMPASGYIKFREVDGAFAVGTLTGIGADATSADVAGWIEVVMDNSTLITVPRLGEFRTRGTWFYLDNTNGSIAQTIQVPTNGGGSGTHCPGLWIETSPGSNSYEFWPALNGSTNGWARQHIGGPFSSTDKRQNFVKSLGSGQLQIGEASDLSATYANVAAQASTYATLAHSCTYTWANDIVTVTYSTGHLLTTGQQVGLDFTSGGATSNDGIYTITVIDAYTYTVSLAGSGASGNVTARPGVTVTFTAHTLGVGDTVYCDFTTGSGVDGQYTIYAVTSANAYLIEYPHTSALTSGNVSVHSRFQITFTAHGLSVGNRVYLDFTTGAGVDGIYTIVATAANTFDVIAHNSGSATSGNVTIKQTIGNIPESGCKIRIPNIFLRECSTAARASNQVNGTIANRPEFSTTNAGAIDIQYVYDTWYHNYSQPYSIKLKYSATFDYIAISECASALDIDNMNTGMHSALDVVTFTCTSNFAGGTVNNCNFQRGNTPGTSDHAISISNCNNITFSNITCGIIQYARSSGKSISVSYCDGLVFNNINNYNSDLPFTASSNITITNLNHVDRYIGYTNSTTAYYAIALGAGCYNFTINGITFGYGTISNVHPYTGIINVTACVNIKLRNAGSFSSPLACGDWRPNLYALATIMVTGGNNNTIKLQRIYIDDNARSGGISTINSDKNIIFESVRSGRYIMSAMAIFTQINAFLNCNMKGCTVGNTTTTAQASVYGTHYSDFFLGNDSGRLILTFNEPTSETSSKFTMVSGSQKFNSSGGIILGTIGDQAIWEDSVYRLGHTGFQNVTPTMSGGTIGHYTIEYQLDTGSGFSGTWQTATGANLSAESIDPSIGFKIKVRITTVTTNSNPITYLRFDTTSSSSAQQNNLYPLDVTEANLVLNNLQVGTEIHVYDSSSDVELAGNESVTGSTFTYQYTWTGVDSSVYITVLRTGYQWIRYSDQNLEQDGLTIPVFQLIDRNYNNPI